MSIPVNSGGPTRIDIHPEPRAKQEAHAPMRSKQIQKDTAEYNGDISFGDVLDFINPLQHIPIVGNIYRAITGDEISTGARMAGGALFGGVIGFIAAGLTEAFEEGTGKTVETHLAELTAPEEVGQTQPELRMAAAMSATNAAPPVTAHTYTPAPPLQAARQALAKPTASAAPALDPLDLSEIEAAKPTPIPMLEKGKSDAILDLFGQHMSSVTDTYNRSQMLSYTTQIASEMKA